MEKINAYNITKREKEVLFLVIEGLNDKEIGKFLCISLSTVKAHVSSLLRKLGVRNRVQITAKALREGLIV